MRPRKPRSLWEEVRAAVAGWWEGGDDGKAEEDPSLGFHLLFAIPFLLALISGVRHMMGA